MKRRIVTGLMCALLPFGAKAMMIDADTLISTAVTKQKVIENGGEGMYRSIVVTDKSLTGYTIYRPRDVQWAAKHEGRLPLLIWANGACGDDNSGYQNMLNYMASNGYVVIALGLQKVNDGDPSGGATSEKQMIEALNWMVKQVSNAKSDYYRAVDVNKVALSGHSCGGAEAIANCGNSRVKTLLIMNAGMGGMSMGGATPSTLLSLHCPIIYLTGGPDDVAYANAQTDFNSISKVGVVWADLSNAGHGGTYWHQHGGDFGRIALKWMDWHLKGKTQNAPIFLKPDYSDFSGWKFESRNFSKKDYEADYDAGPTVADTLFDRAALDETFAFGADISHTTKLESQSTAFYNRQGKKVDIMNILKDEGMNAVRFRVWVNPSESFCNKADVLKLCNRAKKQGLDIMIDFHYSDFWANGGNQFKPAKWEGHSVDKLVTDVYDHTYDVLNTLKNAGVKVRWAQIGNDVENGMLWGDGRIGKGNFVRFVNSAYSAIKAVYPDAEAVLHVAGGQDIESLETFFDRLQKQEAKWDAIGLSAFPKWSGLKNDVLIEKTVASVKGLKEKYGKPVMIVETGHYNNKPLESNNFLCQFIDTLVQAGASGLFYWEPEVVKDYELGAWNPLSGQPSIALDAFAGLKHEAVPYVMKVEWGMPADTIVQNTDPLEIPIEASHIREGRLSKVELMLKSTVLATAQEGKSIMKVEALDKGVNLLYIRATSTDGYKMNTDTCMVIQGPLTVADQTYKEQPQGSGPQQVWSIDVKGAGDYMLVFKYQTSEVLSPRIFLDDTRIGSQRFNVTEGDKYGYVSRTVNVEKTGKLLITLQAASTKVSIPEVESLMIIPLEGQTVPTAEDPTSVLFIQQNAQGEYYDLLGRKVENTGKGIYVQKGKAVRKK